MSRTIAQSPLAQAANALILQLQQHYVSTLNALTHQQGDSTELQPLEWLRAEGCFGGGVRYGTGDTPVWNRASINYSQVHYDSEPSKPLASATALSAIVHPEHPFAPSLHLHLSWTEYKDGQGYWRMMADLNPAMISDGLADDLLAVWQQASPEHYNSALSQGDRYFYIPSLDRHRGIAHYYLEAFHSGDWEADAQLAQRLITGTIDTYAQILIRQWAAHPTFSEADRAAQLAYHSLYFLQVLTLDRGTTSGLLVHSENDTGILGSLPAQVNRELLQEWVSLQPAPQDQLLQALIAALPAGNPAPVNEEAKQALAQVSRAHYRKYPEALKMQATGDVVPPTVANHRP